MFRLLLNDFQTSIQKLDSIFKHLKKSFLFLDFEKTNLHRRYAS